VIELRDCGGGSSISHERTDPFRPAAPTHDLFGLVGDATKRWLKQACSTLEPTGLGRTKGIDSTPLRLCKLALFKRRVKMGGSQLELSFRRGRGGARPGAGRKRLPGRQRHTPHRARAAHRAGHPVHVTLRAASRSLRRRFVSKTVLRALRDSNSAHFRVVHYSVQDNHVHLIVEAASTAALWSGMRGLTVRVARRVNRVLFRRGRFWADRWHGRALTAPRQVRNALVYVLQNRLKHCQRIHSDGRAASAYSALDPLSSAQWFHGFATSLPLGFRSVGPPCVVPAKTWLLTVGWLRHGRIRIGEVPKS